MYIVTISYGQPHDQAAFDSYYAESHLPLVGQIPGVQSFAYGTCEALDGQPAAAYAQAVLTFADQQSAGAALGSPQGQAAAADFGNFATGGASMTFTQVSVATP